jgi:hypothetical protein
LICRQLGPDHALSKALREAQDHPGKEKQPADLESKLCELVEDSAFAATLQQLLKSPTTVTVQANSIRQEGIITGVGDIRVAAHTIGSSVTSPSSTEVTPLPDQADRLINITQRDVTIGVVGNAEIHIWRGPPEPARQLVAVRGFVGRVGEFRWLLRVLRRRPDNAPVAVVVGGPGVGKTDLALVAANHLASSDYPDLQLQVGLSSQGGAVTDPDDALRWILLALGVAPDDLPEGGDQRAAHYRAALNGKRALVVLDDVASHHQVVPLLPPQGCAAIVTSRAPLGGLLERGAKPLQLGRLSRIEALALLASRLGWVRVALQPWGAGRLIDACDGLPQALVIVAALLADPAEQRTRLRRIARDLHHQPIQPGARLRGLAAVFALSYRQLPDQQRYTFQLLGLLNSTDVDTGTVAAAAGIGTDETERRLKALASTSLLEGRPGHWRLRPLVLGYARERAEQDLHEPARSNALRRALDYQLDQVRSLRRTITEVAKLDPAEAARLQAELDRQLARGAVLVDAAVRDGLDLLGLVAEDLVDVLHDVIGNWPDPLRARQALTGIRRVALRGTPEASERAQAWLQQHPEQPHRRSSGRRDSSVYPPAPPVPGPEQMRAFRELAEHLGAAEADGRLPAWPEPVDEQPSHQGTVTISGSGFLPQESILVSLDGDQGWETSADASGDFTTSTAYGPQPSRPRHVTAIGTFSGQRAEAWLE